MIIVNPIVRLKITSAGPSFCFAEIVGETPETVFISHKNRCAVANAGKKSARFDKSLPCLSSYFINTGDIIVAEIGDGNEKRKMALNWAPETVWDGIRGSAGNTAGKVFDFIKAIDLAKLDPKKDGGVNVRVKDSNGKQFARGYGNLTKLLDERTHQEIKDFAQSGSVVEACINGRWVQIKNPFVIALIPKIAA